MGDAVEVREQRKVLQMKEVAQFSNTLRDTLHHADCEIKMARSALNLVIAKVAGNAPLGHETALAERRDLLQVPVEDARAHGCLFFFGHSIA